MIIDLPLHDVIVMGRRGVNYYDDITSQNTLLDNVKKIIICFVVMSVRERFENIVSWDRKSCPEHVFRH